MIYRDWRWSGESADGVRLHYQVTMTGKQAGVQLKIAAQGSVILFRL